MKLFPILLSGALAAGTGAGVVWWLMPTHEHQPVAQTSPDGEVYWTCTMHPEVRMRTAGSCPICGMQLVQRRAQHTHDQHGTSAPSIQVPAQMRQNLGIRTAVVERGTFWQRVDTLGSVDVDARRIRTIESRAAGWIEDQHVHTPGERVQAGDVLAGIYAPELYAAQEELLLARRGGDADLSAAARQRLKLLGANDAQIDRVIRGGRALRTLPLIAPGNGIVLDIDVHEGRQVAPGMPLARIADLSEVWILAEVPERQATWITTGRPAEARLPALPGQVFEGRVDYLYPSIDPATRTRRVRVVFDNPDWQLMPGMYAEVALFGGPRQERLLIPSEALIRTGTRSVVIVDDGEAGFRPVDVVAGDERGGQIEILSGLEEGQRIVVSGQFLIDSEASLRGMSRRIGHAHETAP